MKLISWNVNGIRAVWKKGFQEWLMKEKPDLLSVQETKAHEHQLTPEQKNIPGYESLWCSGERKGYSGVVNFAKKLPENVEYGFGMNSKFDREGRILITDYMDFRLLNIYFPNGKQNDERLQYKLDFYDATLDYCEKSRKKGKEIVVCGDFNTAHNKIDLANPKANEKTSGFLRIERDWMDKFENHGYVDTFRHFFPDKTEMYSWWSYRTAARKRNVGWRLDYFYVSEGLINRISNPRIMTEVMGSDHCPVSIELE